MYKVILILVISKLETTLVTDHNSSNFHFLVCPSLSKRVRLETGVDGALSFLLLLLSSIAQDFSKNDWLCPIPHRAVDWKRQYPKIGLNQSIQQCCLTNHEV